MLRASGCVPDHHFGSCGGTVGPGSGAEGAPCRSESRDGLPPGPLTQNSRVESTVKEFLRRDEDPALSGRPCEAATKGTGGRLVVSGRGRVWYEERGLTLSLSFCPDGLGDGHGPCVVLAFGVRSCHSGVCLWVGVVLRESQVPFRGVVSLANVGDPNVRSRRERRPGRNRDPLPDDRGYTSTSLTPCVVHA